MRIAIDLVWIKHNKMGGLESYVRNLLDAFVISNFSFEFIILLSDNIYDSFKEYEKDNRIQLIRCPVDSENLLRVTIWENLKMDKMITKLDVDYCFVPYYRMPIFRNINRYLITIHDLIPLHFQDSFSFLKILWMKYYWKEVVKKSYHIIAISSFQKKDIVENFGCSQEKISVIYNPIITEKPKGTDFDLLRTKYDIEQGKYFYTISSRYRHKNLNTLLLMMKKLKNTRGSTCKLLISGVSAGDKSSMESYIEGLGISDICILTGFVCNEERNCLLANAGYFLFPSVFEGFGMPPIEAMRYGTKCITTKCASLLEVTQGKAYYVDNPYDIDEWIYLIEKHADDVGIKYDFLDYAPEKIGTDYFNLLSSLI